VLAKRHMETALRSEWGRLFRNWESVKSDANGYPDIGQEGVELQRVGLKALLTSVGILGTCIKEAPEFSTKRRKVVTTPPQPPHSH
jgi:hypothetical protein